MLLTDLGHVDDHHLGGTVLHGEQLHVERELGAHEVVRLRSAEESVVARALTRSDRSREPVGALRTGDSRIVQIGPTGVSTPRPESESVYTE